MRNTRECVIPDRTWGRGAQEGIFAELKSHCHQDCIPVRTLHGNQIYLLAGLFAYNFVRELQMQTTKLLRCTTAKRVSLWIFERVDTLRKTLIQRAGRLTRPLCLRIKRMNPFFSFLFPCLSQTEHFRENMLLSSNNQPHSENCPFLSAPRDSQYPQEQI